MIEDIYKDDTLTRGNARVEWVDLGEGWDGDYDPDDPEDTPLLRFDVQKWFEAGQEDDEGYSVQESEFRTLHDASYCTQFHRDSSQEQKNKALKIIMDVCYDRIVAGDSVKKLCEALSWISNKDIEDDGASIKEENQDRILTEKSFQ